MLCACICLLAYVWVYKEFIHTALNQCWTMNENSNTQQQSDIKKIASTIRFVYHYGTMIRYLPSISSSSCFCVCIPCAPYTFYSHTQTNTRIHVRFVCVVVAWLQSPDVALLLLLLLQQQQQQPTRLVSFFVSQTGGVFISRFSFCCCFQNEPFVKLKSKKKAKQCSINKTSFTIFSFFYLRPLKISLTWYRNPCMFFFILATWNEIHSNCELRESNQNRIK